MRRRLSHPPKIAGRSHDAAAEVPTPDTIHHHPRHERISGAVSHSASSLRLPAGLESALSRPVFSASALRSMRRDRLFGPRDFTPGEKMDRRHQLSLLIGEDRRRGDFENSVKRCAGR